MLEFIRSNRRLLQFVLLLFIVPSFVVVGAWDMVNPNAGANTVAVVNGKKIDRSAWEEAHRRSIDNMSQQFGGQLPADLINTPAARQSSLEELVTRALIIEAANAQGLRVSDEFLKSIISNIPEFQEAGVFKLEKAQAFLKSRGLTSEGFEAGLRQDLSAEWLPRSIADSSIGSRRLARQLSRAETELRELRIERFSPQSFLSQSVPSADEIRAHFDASASRYQSAEQVDLELVILSGQRSAADIESFANIVYEQSDSLAPASEKFKLPIIRVKNLERGRSVSVAQAGSNEAALVLNHPKLADQIFRPDVVTDRRNTESVEIRPGLHASLRVADYRPARPLPFDAVAGAIRAELQQKKAEKLAVDAALAWGQQSNAGRSVRIERADAAGAIKAVGLTTESSNARRVLTELFSDSLRAGQPKVIDLGRDGSLAVVLVSTRLQASDAPLVRQRLGAAFSLIEQIDGEAATRSWLQEMENRYEVERFPKRLEAAAS